MGMARVRNRTEPRTSPMTLAVSPATSSCSVRGFGAIFIAERQMVEQVFRGEDALFRERFRDARADPLDELNGRIDREHALDAN